MALYEASQLSTQGEIVLDEAEEFSRQILEETMKLVDDDQARMVRHTLQNPYHKSLPLSNFKNSIKDFKGTVLYELAELEFQKVMERLRSRTRANPCERSTFEILPLVHG
ncbi:(3S,6E)-nerolidol synthase 1 [Tanacetum coccineum]